MKTVTGSEYIAAIEKNGLPQAYGFFFKTKDIVANDPNTIEESKQSIVSTCAVGQAAINLGIRPHIVRDYNGDFQRLISKVVSLNDAYRYTFSEIASRLRLYFPAYEAMTAEFEEYDYSQWSK